MVDKTSERIINQYLYGQEVTPKTEERVDGKWIRPAKTTSSIDLSARDFMNGPGRFALAPQFDFINDFFTADSSKLKPGKYTKKQIAEDVFG